MLAFPLRQNRRRSRASYLALWTLVLAATALCHSGPCQAGPLAAEDDLATQSTGKTTTFIIARHAERDGNRDVLTEAGKDRAMALRELGTILNVTAVYSTKTDRTINTAKPLADAIGAKINLYRRVDQSWIQQLKEQHAGEVVLIIGHSNTTGVIAGLFADKRPFPIAHDEYDALFVITLADSSTNCVRLRYGPSSAGAPAADADKMGEHPLK